MQPASHIDDDALSAFVDQQLSPDEFARASSHLEACLECQERLDGFRAVLTLLGQLPDVELPRDFALGPRVVAEAPNVVRLRRWYVAARTSAAALAAVFVFLAAGTLYFAAQPAAPATRPQLSSAAAGNAPAAPARPEATSSAPPPAVGAARSPESAAQARAATGDASAPHPALSPQADDQVAAGTSVSPLPTPPPTPVPTAVPAPVAAAVESGPGAWLGLGAVAAGILALAALLLAMLARRRLQRASTA